MPSIETVPPVIVALDVSSYDKAREVLEVLGPVDRDEIAIQFRSSFVAANGLDVISKTKKAGWEVRVGTRLNDSAEKLTIDLENYLSGIDEEHFPGSITMVPPTTTDTELQATLAAGIEKLKEKAGIGVVGLTQPDNFYPNDYLEIGHQAFVTLERAETLGMDGLEVAFAGLEDFYSELERRAPITPKQDSESAEEVADTKQDSRKEPYVIVSKIQNMPPAVVMEMEESHRSVDDVTRLRICATHIFGLGASSILLGSTVVNAEDPLVPVREVLAAHKDAVA